MPHRSAISTEQAIVDIRQDGYCVLPGMCPPAVREELLKLALDLAANPQPPLEYEADTGYPGAPASLQSPGGRTLRRLRATFARHSSFQEQARNPVVLDIVAGLLAAPLILSQVHHNCVMFKHPRYGSETGWHQDMRYWRFARPDLITSWFALTDAGTNAGCLYFVPGSHRMEFTPDRFDADQFFRPEIHENTELLKSAIPVPLTAGDVVLFHSRLLHAAYRNTSPDTRVSLIFTYHNQDNRPIPGTRSAAYPEVSVRE